ncbi:formate dehydrogenase subunit alpha [Bdellovibrionota bacterium FG-1]
MNPVRVEINGKAVQVTTGTSILDTIRLAGFEVPTLCHDSRMAPAASCRICEVQVVGQDRLVCACSTPVEDKMAIQTHAPVVEEFRRSALALLARNYPKKAVEQFPSRLFHKHLKEYGIELGTEPQKTSDPTDFKHPYIQMDMNRCIHCYRCVYICEDLQGQFVWKRVNRGANTQIVPNAGTTLLESSCVSCGACVDTCPTGALEDASLVAAGDPTTWVRTTCAYCGTGCEVNVGVKNDAIVVMRPVLDAPASKGHLCVKGRYGAGYVDSADRITTPMIRRNGTWAKVSWDEALDETAKTLTRIQKDHGSDAIGVLGSSRATNEDSYLANKFARVVVGTNNVDCCARVCHGPSAAGLGIVFGTGAATNGFDDIEEAHSFFLVGSNPTENHPIVGARIKQRVLAGIPIVVIDPRKTELARLATTHLAPKPGTNIPLLNAIAHVIIQKGLEDQSFIQNRTLAFSEFKKSLEKWTPEYAAQICQVEAKDIVDAARIYATSRPAMCLHGLGITEHIQGTEGVMALANLAMLTGNLGHAGAGVNPLRGQNNVQGTANMGCEPSKLTGYQKFEAVRELHEKVWGCVLPKNPGLDLVEMLDAATAQRMKALLVIGYDVLLSHPNLHATTQSFRALESVIVVDMFMNETAKQFGTIFLPTASAFEKDGTFMNGERRIQRVRRAISARGDAKTDFDILCLLAKRMGFESSFAFKDAEAIWNEVRQVWPAVAGISYQRLEDGGIQWPCPTKDHPGTRVLHQTSFPIGPRASFQILEYRPSASVVSSQFPFLLNTGRSLYHFNAATMSGRTRNRELQADDLIEINPTDALRLGIDQHVPVEVESKYGRFVGRAWLTDRVREGELFSTFHDIEAMVNHVTGAGRDSVTHTPEYKVTAVTIRRNPG